MARRAAALISVVLAIVLVGCQSDPAARSGSDSSGGGSTAPAMISTAFGDVRPPDDPKRVVALGWGDAEAALALGVQPVGAADWLAFGGAGVGPWAEDLYDKPPKILGTLELSYEDVAALKPDLILDTKSAGDKGRYDKLAKIAPTVGIPTGAQNYTTSTDQQVKMIGQALGRSDRATALLDKAHAEFAATAKKYPTLQGQTVTVAAQTTEGWGAYIRSTDRVRFMESLGMKNSPEVDAAEPDGFTVPVSRENLDLLDADLLVVMPIGVTSAQIEKNKIFRQVPAVKKGHYVILDDPKISKAYALDSVLSLQFALSKVAPKLSAALN